MLEFRPSDRHRTHALEVYRGQVRLGTIEFAPQARFSSTPEAEWDIVPEEWDEIVRQSGHASHSQVNT